MTKQVQFLTKIKFGGQWYEGGVPVSVPKELYNEALKIGAFKVESQGEVVEEETKVLESTKGIVEKEQEKEPRIEELKPSGSSVDLRELKKAEVQKLAEEKGVEFVDSDTKAVLIEKLIK